MIGLTPKQHECLVFLRSYFSENGLAPSQQEICKALGIISKSGALRILNALEERGYIRKLKFRARAFEILPHPEQHDPQCGCDRCARARYIAQLKLVHALKVDPPVAILRVRSSDLRPISKTTRAELLGVDARDAAPRTRTALPREAS